MTQSGTRQELLAKLQGQEFHFPELRLMFKHWPMDINPAIEEIRALVPKRLFRCAIYYFTRLRDDCMILTYAILVSLNLRRSGEY